MVFTKAVSGFKIGSESFLIARWNSFKKQLAFTVPPETTDPFAAFFSRSIRGSTPRFHLANNAACRKNSSVLPKFTAACDSAVKAVPR